MDAKQHATGKPMGQDFEWLRILLPTQGTEV